MLFQMAMCNGIPPQGPIVTDGFESFEYGQSHPVQHHPVVEAETGSWLYPIDPDLGRKGRMTKCQCRWRAELGEKHDLPDPQVIFEKMRDPLEVGLARSDRSDICARTT